MSVIQSNEPQGADAQAHLHVVELGALWTQLLAEIDALPPNPRASLLERILIDVAKRGEEVA